jgi:hypothetical protein
VISGQKSAPDERAFLLGQYIYIEGAPLKLPLLEWGSFLVGEKTHSSQHQA